MSGYTEEELALLSEEEREAIAADSPEADRELLEAVAGDDAGDEGEGDQAGDAGDDAQNKDEADGDEGAAAGDDAVSGDDADDKADFVPKYHAPAVDDYAVKLTALDESFQSGDVELKDYNAQRDALVRQQLKAEIASEQNAQVEEQLWQREISDFMDAHKEYGNKFRHAALDIAVKDLAADEANADKPGRWFLREAHKIVEREFGATAQQEKPPADNGDDKKPAGNGRKPDLSVVPKTLAHLPAAELPDTGSVDEFAHLDRLTGLELENAVSRLSATERERYRAA